MTEVKYAQVAILGSCVSRDLVRISLSEEAKCPLYIARQSILSYGRPATENKPAEPSFNHPFQLTSYRSDVNGTGLKQVLRASKDIDVLLIDLVDERHGVFASPLGEVITQSIDGMKTGLYDTLDGWEHVPFGTPDHLRAFAQQAEMMRDQLAKAELFDRTIVILAPWATHLSTGERTPWSMGKTAEWANSVLPDYEQVFEDLGYQTVRPDPETVVGDPEHQWGPAPFHYIKNFYDSLAAQIRPFTKAHASR